MGIKFSNNASANIIRALTSTATSVSVTAGKGDLFPSLTEGDYFYATLAGNNGLEIVKVTNRVNDTMTIVRAQDDTTALSFDTGDLFELRIVAADFNDTFSEVNDKLEASQDVLERQIDNLAGVVSGNATSQAVKDAEQDAKIAEADAKIAEAMDKVGLPLGFEYFQTNPNVQAGSLPMVGGLWSRSIYAELWGWVQKQPGYLITEKEWQEKAAANGGAVPFYSDGDGATTFRVPALTVWCKGQGGNEAVGDYLADMFESHKHNVTVEASGSTEEAGGHTHTRGTMEITGQLGSVRSGSSEGGGSNVCSGAFTEGDTIGSKTSGAGASSEQYWRLTHFTASRSWTGETSNAGNHSHTVTLNTTVSEDEQGGTETRPRTIVGLYCVVAYGSAFSSGAIDLEDVHDLLLETQEVVEEATKDAVKTVNGEKPDASGNVDVGGMPLGTLIPYTGKDVPAGTLRADGTTYTDMRSSFPEFYEWVVNSGITVPLADYALVESSCGYYGLDTSTGTVRMPTLAAGVFGTTTAGQYGAAVQAGLPNITGDFVGLTIKNNNSEIGGAFQKEAQWNGAAIDNTNNTESGAPYNFNASRSSAIYGRSDTVTPSHVKYPWVIVVYNAAVPPSVAQAGEFMGLLDGKVDKVNPKDSEGNNILTSAGGTLTGGLNLNSNGLTNVNHMEMTATEHGGNIDFHFANSSQDFTSRIIETSAGRLEVSASEGLYVNGAPVHTLVATWRSGASWYRKWSDGFIEQGGDYRNKADWKFNTITLHTAFATTNYFVVGQEWQYQGSSNDHKPNNMLKSKSTTSFSLETFNPGSLWYACGY